MSKTPQYDTKVKAILDATQPGERICALTAEKWILTEREIEWCRYFNVPVSTLSPEARWMTLGGLLMGYEWWWNKHAETGAPILTYVHPATGVRVLPDKEWLEKDFRSHAREFQTDRPFFDQLLELRRSVPVNAFFNQKEPQNSIALISNGDVNSYFVIACNSKSCFYSSDLLGGEECTEVYAGIDLSLCVNVVHGQRLHNCRYIRESYDCSNSAFLFDCRNCEFCFGATNKRNRKFVWFNEQLTESAYRERIRQVDLGKRSEWQRWEQKFLELLEKDGIWPENFNEKVENCDGEYLTNCTNCIYCFMGAAGPKDNERCYYVYGNAEKNYFSIGQFSPTNCYCTSAAQESNSVKFSMNLIRCQNVEYSLNCQNCEFCFGCVGLNRQKYCIFNKQYTESEYWQSLDKIKCHLLERNEYGNPLSGAFSTSYPLESSAQESLGMTEEDVKRLGFLPFDRDADGAIGKLSEATTLQKSSEVPDCIDDVNVDAWAGKPLLDESTGRRFAYLKPELEYYRRLRIPLPTEHFFRRVDRLYWAANAFHLMDAVCRECAKLIHIAPNRTYKNRQHLCRPCYLSFLEKHG